jgi:hypothetical protein
LVVGWCLHLLWLEDVVGWCLHLLGLLRVGFELSLLGSGLVCGLCLHLLGLVRLLLRISLCLFAFRRCAHLARHLAADNQRGTNG